MSQFQPYPQGTRYYLPSGTAPKLYVHNYIYICQVIEWSPLHPSPLKCSIDQFFRVGWGRIILYFNRDLHSWEGKVDIRVSLKKKGS